MAKLVLKQSVKAHGPLVLILFSSTLIFPIDLSDAVLYFSLSSNSSLMNVKFESYSPLHTKDPGLDMSRSGLMSNSET